WEWAGSEGATGPDIVMACAGDVPTQETLAAVSLLREQVPRLGIRVVNVVDLMALQPQTVHPHGQSDAQFASLFTTDCPVIFAYHGYPQLIHRLIYRRANHGNFHVHGFNEEGTTTTPFDIAVLNRVDRFNLAMGAIRHAGGCGEKGQQAQRLFSDALVRHHRSIREFGDDMPEVSEVASAA